MAGAVDPPGPDFENARPDFESAGRDFEAAGPDFEAAWPDFEAAGPDWGASLQGGGRNLWCPARRALKGKYFLGVDPGSFGRNMKNQTTSKTLCVCPRLPMST